MISSRARFVTSLMVSLASGIGTIAPVAADNPAAHGKSGANKESVIFFVADGMRQDIAESYAAKGLMPATAKLLRSGAKAAGGGLLTQAPPNTGAGWYTLATGAWPGVHGSTNSTFAISS